jgi:hypothetical protein
VNAWGSSLTDLRRLTVFATALRCLRQLSGVVATADATKSFYSRGLIVAANPG